MTAADGDGDGEMGSNNGNGAAIADEVRHGRTAPFSARATAAAKETTKVLKIESGTGPLDQAKVALPTSG